jgi:hypothetical protein
MDALPSVLIIELLYRNLDEKCSLFEKELQSMVTRSQQELDAFQHKVHGSVHEKTKLIFIFIALQCDLEKEKRKNLDIQDQYAERGRQLQKLQVHKRRQKMNAATS